ncbi:MAG: hypothetical protein ACREOO_31435 [bacterium]
MERPAAQPHPGGVAYERSAQPFCNRDDFMLIAGIDPVMEMALNSLGIRQFLDFGGCSPLQLSNALRQRTGVSISADEIERQDWIGQASALSIANMPQKSLETEATEKHTRAAADPRFQANKPQVASAPESTATLNIMSAAFEQMAEPVREQASGSKRLRAKITCEVRHVLAWKAKAPQAALCAQIYATEEATGKIALWDWQTFELDPANTTHTIELELRVAKLGRYHLHIVTFLLGDHPRICVKLGPVLRVI